MSDTIPAHIGIIMDGNRRWAKNQNLPSLKGHQKGYETFLDIAEYAFEKGVSVLSVYAFSTENWKRAEEEVGYLMGLLRKAVNESYKRLHEKGIRILISGRTHELPGKLKEDVKRVEEETKENTKGVLHIALNYGGRPEIVDAVNAILKKGDLKKVTEEDFAQHLYNPEVPDLDLIIRTSGEQRLSGFFPWQGIYAELLFVKKHWPDFTKDDLDDAIIEYANRQRRFGGN